MKAQKYGRESRKNAHEVAAPVAGAKDERRMAK
jgi:hypothetical protein